jgi:hypothetical protein
MDPTKEQHQILCISGKKCNGDKRLGKKVRAVHGKSKLTETEKRRQVKSEARSMLIIFFDIKGIVHKDFVLAGQTFNSAYYFDALWRLGEYVQTLVAKNWLLHDDNAPSHTYFYTREFLTKINMTVICCR